MNKKRRSSISSVRKSIGTTDCQLAIYTKVEKCLRSSFEKACQEMLDQQKIECCNFRQDCLENIVELSRDVSRSTPVPLIQHSPKKSHLSLLNSKKVLEEINQKYLKEDKEWKCLGEKMKLESKQTQKEYSTKSDVPHMDISDMNAKYQKQLLKKPDYKDILTKCRRDLMDINEHITKEVLTSERNGMHSIAHKKDLRAFTNMLHEKLIFSGRDIAKCLV